MKMLKYYFAVLLVALTVGCSKDDDDDVQKSNQKKIISFTITSADPVTVGVIDETNKTITLSNVAAEDVTALIPLIVVSEDAVITPASGLAQNFTSPVIYTVTAEDGSVETYTVSVTSLAAITLSGTMSANKTLIDRGPGIDYVIEGTCYIDGNALLTVNPGVTIAFTGTDGWIEVGQNAGLKMVGTATKPILLTGPVNNPNKGAWGGVEFRSNRADNMMEYVIVENAGSNSDYGAITVAQDARLSIKNCTITRSASNGLYNYGTVTSFENNIIRQCDKAPVRIASFDKVFLIDAASQLSENTPEAFVQINYGYAENVDITICDVDIPYLVNEGIYVEETLTINAGVTLLFNDDTYIEVISAGKITANGTTEKPITFSHVEGETGQWQGVYIYSSVSNSLQHCIIEHGGSGSESQNLYVNESAKVSLSDCVIRNSTGYGVVLYNSSNVTASNVTFSACAEGNVYNADEDVISTSF